jgi:phosphoserine phosphatase
MLAGKSSRLFDQLIATATPTSGAIELVHTMRANGAKCYLVSGGFDFITGPVAALCGFHDHHANHMHVRNSKILGTVRTPILNGNAKAIYLAHYCKQNGIDPIDAATIGDGANDLAMLQASGMGVAFEGKPLLLAKVAIQLNHTDLRGLLYLQGYKERDFIVDKT